MEFFNFGNILFFSDWTHWTNEAVKDILNGGWGAWIGYFNFGTDNIQYYFNLFSGIWGMIGNYDIATKITFFIPIALLSFLSPFFLIRYYTRNDGVAFLISLFYGLNTYFIVRQTSHLPIAFVIGLIPLLFLYFDRFLREMRRGDFYIFTVLYFIGVCYEIRMMYITSLLLFIYLLFIGGREVLNKKIFQYVCLFLILQIGLNFFWILPTLLASGQSIASTVNRGLFGNGLFDLLYAFNIFDSSWTGGSPAQDFVPRSIPLYFWFYPAIFIFSLLFFPRDDREKRKLFLFGVIVSLIGILLTKQSAPPFPWLYEWLYYNFPGFSLFREGSKFYIITLLGYSIVFAVFLDFLSRMKRMWFYGTTICMLIISFLIAKPLITREIGTVFIPRIEPNEYRILDETLYKNDSFYKTLWVPKDSQWGYFDVRKPKMGLVTLAGESYNALYTTPISKRNYSDVASFLFEPLSDTLLDISGIRYVIVGLKDEVNEDNFFRFYGSTPKQYSDALGKFPFLREIHIPGIRETQIFENTGYLSPIFLSSDTIGKSNMDDLIYKDLDFTQVNPSHYTVSINLEDRIRHINISQKFNKNWSLFIGPFTWCKIIGGNSVLEKKQDESLDFINAWSLSREEIVRLVHDNFSQELSAGGFPKKKLDGTTDYKYYVLHPDGSIDIRVTLYFRPQSYFYLGIIVSATTCIVLIGYLIYAGSRRRHNRIPISSSHQI